MLKKYLMRLTWATCTFVILPGNHLCSFHTLRLPDNANSFLRIVQVVQQHTYGVVPISGASIGLQSFHIPDCHHMLLISEAAMNKKPISMNLVARTYLLSACMALAYWRCIFGEEIFGSNSPTFNLSAKWGKKSNCIAERNFQSTERMLFFSHQFLDRM